MSQCCVTGFNWDGKPSGKEDKVAQNDVYVAGINKDVAIIIIHDVFGWTFPNARILADHFASEVNATVYLPDFFGGEVVTFEDYQSGNFDLGTFLGRNSKEKRFPEMVALTKSLKQDLGFKKVGAIGYCWGGWAAFQLGAKDQNLLDAISTAHPSLLTKEEIDAVSVPVQILAPEHDPAFTPELKEHANKVIPTKNVEFDYQYFPGLAHGFASKGDPNNKAQKDGLERAKNAAAGWFAQILHFH